METISPNSQAVRSTFLTVLCVLTFIGSGWGIIGSVRSYAGADTISSVANGAMQNAEDKMDEQGKTPNFVKQLFSSVAVGLTADNIRKSAIFKLISCLLTLSGAIVMWNLKKAGFYIYILGIIVLVVAPVTIGKLVGAMGASIMGFIGFVFIVMYAVNLNQMNKKA